MISFMAAVGLAGWSFGQGTVAAINGEGQAVIVVGADAGAPEKHAAGELAAFLEQVTGAKFPVCHEYAGPKSRFLVGPAAARLVDNKFSTAGLGREGLIIRTVENNLILAGGDPRGTLYAIYTFLEEVVGCRWWAPGESTIPLQATLEIPALDIRYVPTLEMRETYWYVVQDGDWCVRNKVNGGRTSLAPHQGSKYHEMGGCHSFYVDIPPEMYFKDHPEWFSEINGKRTAGSAQLCMTNEALIHKYADIIKQNLRERPEKGVFFNYIADRKTEEVSAVWVSQNDWNGCCECETCRAINEREGTAAGALLHFVNGVAEQLEADYPDLAVYTFAYVWSQKPPKTIKPRPNVVIWLATTGTAYNFPYAHEINKTFRENLQAWSTIHDRIYIWDYLTNFANYICPHPNLRTLAPNVKYFVNHGVRGIFSEAAANAPGAEMAELRAWVMAKLYWNPALDGDQLIDEFLTGYYGPAGTHIKAYLDVFHDASEASAAPVSMTESPFSDNYLSLETMVQGLVHLQAAETAVAGDPVLARRVEVAKMPALYVFLMRWDEFQEKAKAIGLEWPLDADINTVYDYFEAVRAKNGMNYISQNNERGQWPSVKDRVDQGPPLVPPGCEKLPIDSWADLQNLGFSMKHAEPPALPLANLEVQDEKASNGSAARMRGDHDVKALQRQLWRIPLVIKAAEAQKPLRVFLSIRCELKGRQGVAFRAGIDSKDRDLVVHCADIPDADYHTYDLGVYDSLAGWIHLWIAPGNNPENVEAVWVDRAWLVVEASPAGFVEGFETGTFGQWTTVENDLGHNLFMGVALTMGSIKPHSGNLMAVLPKTAQPMQVIKVMDRPGLGTLTGYICFESFEAGHAGGLEFKASDDSSGAAIVVNLEGDGAVHYHNDMDYKFIASGMSAATGVWHEIKFVVNDGGVSGYWNGTPLFTHYPSPTKDVKKIILGSSVATARCGYDAISFPVPQTQTIPPAAALPPLALNVDNEPFFVLGYYDNFTHSPAETDKYHERYAAYQAQGINTVLHWGSSWQNPVDWQKAAADAAQANGLKYLAQLHYYAVCPRRIPPDGSRYPFELIFDQVDSLCSHPALLGWYVTDEPELEIHAVYPPKHQMIYRRIQEHDPAKHPQFTVHCTPAQEWYVRSEPPLCYDVMMYDLYPCRTGQAEFAANLWSAALAAKQQVLLCKLAGTPKPQIFVAQACGVNEWSGFRLPTFNEQRYLSYAPIVEGSRGLLWWDYGPPEDAAYAQARADYRADIIGPIATEIKSLVPAILSNSTALTITSDHDRDTAGHGMKDVTYLFGEDERCGYLLAVNHTPHTLASVTFQLTGSLSGAAPDAVEVLFENRKVTLQSGSDNWKLTDTFSPYDVNVYRIDKTAAK